MESTNPPAFPRLHATVRRLRAWSSGVPVWIAIPALAVTVRLLALQAQTLPLPIQGEHGWREAVTYSVAYNFRHESFDFFHPRLDITRGLTGITGMEPPVVPFVIALCMRVFGDGTGVARVTVWLISLMGLWASLALVRRIRDAGLTVGFLLAFAMSPLALYELRQIQPDNVAVMVASVAALFFYRFARTEKRSDYAWGMLAFLLAVLSKGPGLILAPAMWWFACADRRIPFRSLVLRGIPFVLPAALLGAWSRWAHYLTRVFNQGTADVSIDLEPAKALQDFVNQDALRNLYSFVYPCYVSNWVLLPALIVGFVLAFQPGTRRVSTAFFLWLIGGSVFLGAFASRLYSHWYYADVVLVPLAYFTAFGLAEVFRLFSRDTLGSETQVTRWAALVVLVTLAAAPLVGGPAQRLNEVVAASGERPEQSWMGQWHMTVLLAVLSGGMIAAQMMSRQKMRWAALVLLPFAAVGGIGRGQQDAVEVLRWRARVFETRAFKERWMDTLRPLVDRYSTRADLFLVDNDNPYWLYLPLRKGWTTESDALKDANFADYQRSGARFFLSYNSRTPPRSMHAELLGSSDYFKLYCLDAKGCKPLSSSTEAPRQRPM